MIESVNETVTVEFRDMNIVYSYFMYVSVYAYMHECRHAYIPTYIDAYFLRLYGVGISFDGGILGQ